MTIFMNFLPNNSNIQHKNKTITHSNCFLCIINNEFLFSLCFQSFTTILFASSKTLWMSVLFLLCYSFSHQLNHKSNCFFLFFQICIHSNCHVSSFFLKITKYHLILYFHVSIIFLFYLIYNILVSFNSKNLFSFS